jgi:hypothetical protein
MTSSASTTTHSPAQSDAHLIGELETLFQDARNRRRPMVRRWLRNYSVVNSRPWSASRATWKPAPDVPEIFPILSARVAWVRETTPQFEAMPVADPNSAFYAFNLDLGNDLKVAMNSVWDEQRFDPELERMLWDVQIYGTGISKTLWDPTAVNGLGNVTMTRVDPFCFYPDPDARDLESANYVFEVQRLTVAELDRRFPGAAARLHGGDGNESLPDEAPNQLGDRGLGSGGLEALGRSGNNPAGTATNPRWTLTTEKSAPFRSATDHVVVYYAWLRETVDADPPELELAADPGTPKELLDNEPNIMSRPDSPRTDSWRCVVYCGATVLLDEFADDLWSHGKHPYDRFVEQDMGEFWGRSMVDLLASAQVSVNRLLAAIEHNIWLMGNPIMVEDKRSGIPRATVTNRPGQRLTTNPGSEVKWLSPPTMQPQMAVELLRFYIGEMERISGISGMVRGATPTGRNASSVLDSLQEAAFVRVRLMIRNLETMLKGVAEKTASLICEFYDTPRLVSLVGPSGEQTSLAIRGEHFYTATDKGRVPMRFQISVEAGSSLPTSKQARMAEADTLFAMQAIDREAVLEAHNFPGRQDVVARMREMEAVNGPMQPTARAAAGRTS